MNKMKGNESHISHQITLVAGQHEFCENFENKHENNS